MTKQKKIAFIANKARSKIRLHRNLPKIANQIANGKSRTEIKRALTRADLSHMKQLQILLYHESKECEICKTSINENHLMLCDRCDDAYHLSCLKDHLDKIPEGSWICPLCEKDASKTHIHLDDSKPQKDEKCVDCKQNIWSLIKLTRIIRRIRKFKNLTQEKKQKLLLRNRMATQQGKIEKVLLIRKSQKVKDKLNKQQQEEEQQEEGQNQMIEQNEQQKEQTNKRKKPIYKIHGQSPQIKLHWINKGILCRHCKCWYHHATCFNPRSNSINCSKCQKKIRRSGPQTHKQFVEYVKSSYLQASKNNTILGFNDSLPDKSDLNSKEKRLFYIGLIVPKTLQSEQQILHQQCTLYYALQTQGMKFLDGQVYQSPNTPIEIHDQQKQVIMNYLSIPDEIAFIEFKSKSRWGFCSPIEIVEDRNIGFYARALKNIKQNTILYEYAGEVINSRDTLNQNNDSIMSLHRKSSSSLSYDLCPTKYGNGSKFIAGINNSIKHSLIQFENVKTMRFIFDKKVRLLFFAKTDIRKGETLYINYNGGAFQQYPTNNFIHKDK